MISNNLHCPFRNAMCRLDCAMLVMNMSKKTYGGCEHITKHYTCAMANRGNVPQLTLNDCFYDETSKEIDY